MFITQLYYFTNILNYKCCW